MHKSVIDFFIRNLTQSDVHDKTVLEAGSLYVNGSVRPFFERLKPSKYLGIDMTDGPGVDICVKIEDFVSEPFDIVVSTETLEHTEDWKAVVNALKALCKPGGTLYVTTRGPGFRRHCYPSDYWRYTQEDFKRIFADLEILLLEDDPQIDPVPYPGVFMKARKPLDFVACSLEGIELAQAPSE